MTSKQSSGGGLSLQTLVIASLSSLAAALFIHKFWQAGAILGAAVTPVIVALVSEGLRRPAEVIGAKTGRTQVEPPPIVTPSRRDDPFGIWEEQKPRRALHLKLALATGLVAFAIAAFFLTGAEFVLGGASDSDKFRVLPGQQDEQDSDGDPKAPASTQPDEASPVPDEESEAPPTVTVTTPPPEEEPPPEDVPEEQAPPAPVPGPGATTPVP